jgi:hypothetical protein
MFIPVLAFPAATEDRSSWAVHDERPVKPEAHMKVPRGSALNLADPDGAVSRCSASSPPAGGFPGPRAPVGQSSGDPPGGTVAPAPRAAVTDVMSGMRHARGGRLHPAWAPASVNFGARLRRPAGAPQRGAGRLRTSHGAAAARRWWPVAEAMLADPVGHAPHSAIQSTARVLTAKHSHRESKAGSRAADGACYGWRQRGRSGPRL